MRIALLSKPHAVMVATLLLTGCDAGDTESLNSDVSYAWREPGSMAMPTNERSFGVLNAEGSVRLIAMRTLIIESGEQCGRILSAVFKSGFEGTDLWRVKCAESDFDVWFERKLKSLDVQLRTLVVKSRPFRATSVAIAIAITKGPLRKSEQLSLQWQIWSNWRLG